MSENHPSAVNRRRLLQAGAAAVFAGPLGAVGAQALPLRAAYRLFGVSNLQDLVGRACAERSSSQAEAVVECVCLAPVPVAIDHGFFQKQNLDVELVNYGGSTDQLLEAIATGKSDAGLGMALRWLEPLSRGSTSRSRQERMAVACAC